MTNVSADQGLVLQLGTDPANEPSAQTAYNAGAESRLVKRYTSIADRTTRNAAPNEGEFSHLADVDRLEVYDGANWMSAYTRSVWASPRIAVGAGQVLTQSNTTLQNVTALVVALPTAGTFRWYTTIFYDASQVADIKFAFTWPAGANGAWGSVGGLAVGATGTTGDGQFGSITASGTSLPFGGANVGTGLAVRLEGDITMGGTAGNLQLQAAQNTSEATNVTVRERSQLVVWRIP